MYRDPVDALVNGALPRAERMGRTVPLAEHAKTHIGASEVVRQLAEHYANNPLVHFDYVDNSRGKGNARLVHLTELPRVEHNDLKEKLNEALIAAHQRGVISDATFNGTQSRQAAGRASMDAGGISGVQQEDRSGICGNPEPEHTGQEINKTLPKGGVSDSGVPQNKVIGGMPIHEIPLADLSLSKDVPQFKLGADQNGVVEKLGGTFDRRGVAPIQVWRRNNGQLEVISGRHRLDLARRSGETTIPAQVHDESNRFTIAHAKTLDAELNIRDGQGKVIDYVDYFKNSGISKAEASDRGLIARNPGKRSYEIATGGGETLIAAIRAGRVGDEAAEKIARAAPNNDGLQSVALHEMQDGMSPDRAIATMLAVKTMGGQGGPETLDMFGHDSGPMLEARAMGKEVSRQQNELSNRISAISGAAKNPELARQEGIDVKNPEAIKERIAALKAQRATWDNWATSTELVGRVRDALGMKPLSDSPSFKLEGQTNSDILAHEQALRDQNNAWRNEDREAQSARDAEDLAERTQSHVGNPDNFQFGENSNDAQQPVDNLFNQPTAKSAKAAIKASDIPAAEQIKLAAELRKGDIMPEDVHAILGEPEAEARSDGDVAQSNHAQSHTDADQSALFRQKSSKADLPPVDQSVIDALINRINGVRQAAGDARITSVFSPLDLPSAVKKQAELEGIPDNEIHGVLYNGRAYIVRQNLKTRQDVEEVLAHEVLGHGGVHALLGDSRESVMLESFNRAGGITQIRLIAERLGVKDELNQRIPKGALSDAQKIAIVDEMLALAQGKNNRLRQAALEWIGKMRDFVIAGLRKAGLDDLANRLDKFDATEAAAMLRKMREAVIEGGDIGGHGMAFMVAWHGSPHDHDRFDSSRIGTGEGAQHFGYGLYFAGAREVAEHYKNTLSKGIDPDRFNFDGEQYAKGSDGDGAFGYTRNGKPVSRADYAKAFQRAQHVYRDVPNGRLYQVELAPREDEYLDWDKPLNEQSATVQEALRGKDFSGANIRFSDIKYNGSNLVFKLEHHLGKKQASEYLHSIGIRGIKYLDENSRAQGKGSHNYVVFNDKDVSILNKFSRAANNSDSATSSTPESIAAALRNHGLTGKTIDKQLQRGEEGKTGGVVIGKDLEDVQRLFKEKTGRELGDEALQSQNSANNPDVHLSENGAVQGFYDPKSGLTFLVADHLNDVTAPAVAAHEILHATQTDEVRTQAADLINNRSEIESASLKKFFSSVNDRMAKAGVEGNAEEAAPYIVEQALIMGRKDGFSAIDNTLFGHLTNKLGKRVGDFVRDFIAKVRVSLLKRGMGLKLTVDDMIAYAQAGMKQAAKGEVNREGETMSPMQRVSAFWNNVAANPGAFKYGQVEQHLTSAEDIARQISTASSRVRGRDVGGQVRGIDVGDGADFMNQHGGIVHVFPASDKRNAEGRFAEYYIQSPGAKSAGRESGDGSALYQAAQKWIYANGGKFVGDDQLTDINRLRATSNQLSSALREKTTEHLDPDKDQGIIGWKDGAHDSNIAALAIRESELAHERIPALHTLFYDHARAGIVDARGTLVERNEIRQILSRVDPHFTQGVGPATAARAIATRAAFYGEDHIGQKSGSDIPGFLRSGLKFGESRPLYSKSRGQDAQDIGEGLPLFSKAPSYANTPEEAEALRRAGAWKEDGAAAKIRPYPIFILQAPSQGI